MIEGALIALAGFLVGRFLPGRRRLARPTLPPAAVCGCRHHASFHDPVTRACHATDRRMKYDEEGYNCGTHDFPCTCRKYTGPEPLPEVFMQEISGV